jgi:two-component system cell cycle sensor histidine kinase/response regulator CckA
LRGGVAHDFNNLLMGIQGRVSLMLMEMDSEHPFCEHLKEIEEYVKSAAGLARQLLSFAKGGKYEVKTANPNEIVGRSAEMFGRTHKEIRIHQDYQHGVWNVDMDQRQIEQML